ncbi:ABC transporter permease [Ktedonospora formicarum]|uniref:ABC transporter permease n=1 Tax=Ktedonospora formicarum TaxID=2778364 RepID=A0A8J3I0J9_9CHLR|nr:ABC transporter permease [Ktedonospora formicarum]GHO43878.1 hypothetical protein KSX_20410 [Ktedonospora formicarum]
MSTLIGNTQASGVVSARRPSFFGLVQGELIKLSRQWMTWIMVLCLVAGTALLQVIIARFGSTQHDIQIQSPNFFYSEMDMTLLIMRAFGGIFLMILTAYLIGMEYQNGTVRIILARGVGRVQLLLAKFTALLVIAIELCVLGVLYNALLTLITLFALGGNLDIISKMSSSVWSNIGLYLISMLISFVVTILMAMTVTALGRSLAFGMSIALAWFAVDNIGTLFLRLGYMFTKQQFFLDITAYLLGPVLNVLPAKMLPQDVRVSQTFSPWIDISESRALVTILVYALVFAVVSIVITWKRDVHE